MPNISWEKLSELKHRQNALYSIFCNCILQMRTVNSSFKELQNEFDKIIDEAEDINERKI